jgi:hypothetical protein
MDTATASLLAARLGSHREQLCRQVAARLLRAYPELAQTLRLEERHHAVERLSKVAAERLSELVRAVLLFELPSLAIEEFTWARDVLLRSGVTGQHQSAMVRYFFEALRQLPLSPAEDELARELEGHFLGAIRQAHQASRPGGAPQDEPLRG